MPVDLFQSRRTFHEMCQYWRRNESDEYAPDRIVFNRVADGIFWAKEVSSEEERNNIVGGVFMFDSSHITIQTPDDLENLKSEDIVLYNDEIWIIVNIQKRKARINQNEYAKDKFCSHYWYLDLRK